MHKYLYILKYIHIYYILHTSFFSLSLSDLVWRLPECWCWQMWQLRGPIFGGWKGGRMWCPFGVPSRYVWSANLFMLFVWAILPAQVSLPSLVEVVGLLHNWIRSPSRPTAEWRSSLHVLVCAPYKFGAPDCILGPDLGHILVLVLGSIFGRGFGALDFVCNCRGPKRCPKMEPETGTKMWPKPGPQNAIRGSKFARRRKQGRVEMIFIQRSV